MLLLMRPRRITLYCCVPQCNSYFKHGLSFHSFPRDVILQKKWMHVLKIGKKVSKYMKVCGLHFTREDYILPGVTKFTHNSFRYQCNIKNRDILQNVQFTHPTAIVATWPHHSQIIYELLVNPATWKMKWIVFTKNATEDLKAFSDSKTYIPVNCEFILAQIIDNSHASLIEIYKTGPNAELQVRHWATWRNGHMEPPKVEVLTRRRNLKGQLIHLGTIKLETYDNDVDFQEKVVGFLRDGMNFTIRSQVSELGSLDDPRTGLFKLLQDKRVELASLPFVITASRLDILTFVWPTTTNKLYMFVTVGEVQDWSSYLKPFGMDLWGALGGWITLTSTLMTAIYKASGSSFSAHNAAADAFLDTFQPFCAQGGAVVPQWTLFIARLMPYVNALVLLPAYSGAILAFLTAPIYNIPFRNLEEFINDGRFKLSIIERSYAYRYFKEDEGETPSKIRSRGLLLRSESLPIDAIEGFSKMCKNPNQVYCETIPPQEGLSCLIKRVRTELFKQSVGLAVADDWPCAAIALRIVRKVQSSGLVDLFQAVHLPSPPELAFKAIGFDSVQPLFVMYFFFISMSILILIAEKYVRKCRKRKKMSLFLGYEE